MSSEDRLSKRNIEVKKQAKEILDKFAKALSKVKTKEDFFVKRKEDRRKESEGFKGDSDFISRFMENAPQTKNKSVVAEKGEWK